MSMEEDRVRGSIVGNSDLGWKLRPAGKYDVYLLMTSGERLPFAEMRIEIDDCPGGCATGEKWGPREHQKMNGGCRGTALLDLWEAQGKCVLEWVEG